MSARPRIVQPIHPDLISREEAAVLLGVSLPSLIRTADTGQLHEYRIAPKFIRLDRVEVEKLVQSRKSA